MALPEGGGYGVAMVFLPRDQHSESACRLHVASVLAAEKLRHAIGGTYVVMEGPQFATLAESRLYRSGDAHVIGMTNMPEAKLAREAEICYCTVAMVTDYDSWHEEHGTVDVAKVIAVMQSNSGNARRLVRRIAQELPQDHQP